MISKRMALAGLLSLAFSQATAAPILVTQQPWGQDTDIGNMTAVFGAGNFTTYTSFAAANPAAVFSAGNEFVMLEGGNGTDTVLANYLTANASTVLAWVNAGGSLLVQSAGWFGDVSFNGVTLDGPDNYNSCGTLTAAGIAAFATATTQCGNYLAHDVVVGAGLTAYMTGNSNGGAIIAGSVVGNGFVMYSGLTTSVWHHNGQSLVNSLIDYTSAQSSPVPEPTVPALLGIAALVALAASRRRVAA